MQRGDLVTLKTSQPLVSGITIAAGTQLQVLAVFTNSHREARANLAKPGTGEVAASCVDVGRLEVIEQSGDSEDDDPFGLFEAA